jgi:hypothetical protein
MDLTNHADINNPKIQNPNVTTHARIASHAAMTKLKLAVASVAAGSPAGD